MTPPMCPVVCNAKAFELLSSVVPRLESPDALLIGATAIASHAGRFTDPAKLDAKLQSYADLVMSRVRGPQLQGVLAHLHDVLFDELKFQGNAEDYYHAANSYLPVVLETKKGLPITLSMVYKSVAERLGLVAYGVGLPGHFLVGVEDGRETPLLVDPFASGKVVAIDEARQRVAALFSDKYSWTDDYLTPVTHRHWLTRMIQNLLHLFGRAGQYNSMAAMLELEMLLWPDQDRLQRDLGLVLARSGQPKPASLWLDYYLSNHPEDPNESELRQLLTAIR